MRESINAVAHTLFEAILLVVIVVMVFLQTWRASIIPLVAVPVSLIGTFAVMLGLGFSLNTLSLFGLVLAIGIVVDDAIVVVENVERHIELGLPPMDATRQGDGGSVGPDHRHRAGARRGVRADGLHQRPDRAVLPAVRADDRDLDGHLGVQLADAEPGAGVAAAAAARRAARSACSAAIDRLFGWFFRGFNRFFARGSSIYAGGVVARAARRGGGAGASTSGWSALTGVGFTRVPQGFVPPQDKDYLVAFAQLPDAATLDRTERVIRQMSALALAHPGVANSVAFPGLSINGFVNASNTGIAFVTLKPADERAGMPGLDANSIVADAESAVRRHPGSVRRASSRRRRCRGSGTVGGFKLYVEDRAGLGFEELYAQVQNAAVGKGSSEPALAGLFSSFQVSVPQIDVARRSRAGQDLRHPADRRLRHAAGLSRIALRERLQPVRTHLSGQRAGRVGVPHAAGADRAAEDAQRRRRDGAARIAAVGSSRTYGPIR